MTRRTAQIESTLKRALSQVLQRELSDPRIEGMVSITQVKVSPDLREAYVSVSVIPEKVQRKTLAGLRHAAGHIHSLVGKKLAMRTNPRLDFRLDETLKKEAAVYDAIRQGLDRSGPEDDGTEPTSGADNEDS